MGSLELRNQLINLKNEALALISDATSQKDLEMIRVSFLGRKGRINQYISRLKSLSEPERSQVGKALNTAKTAIDNELKAQQKRPDLIPTSWTT